MHGIRTDTRALERRSNLLGYIGEDLAKSVALILVLGQPPVQKVVHLGGRQGGGIPRGITSSSCVSKPADQEFSELGVEIVGAGFGVKSVRPVGAQ